MLHVVTALAGTAAETPVVVVAWLADDLLDAGESSRSMFIPGRNACVATDGGYRAAEPAVGWLHTFDEAMNGVRS